MEFEWDSAKHETNLRRRGIGFDEAALIFEGEVIEWPDRRTDYGEVRMNAIGEGKRQNSSGGLHDAPRRGADYHSLESKPEGSAEMAGAEHIRMTPEEIRGQVAERTSEASSEAQRRYDETTEADIRRHMREDGYDPEEESTAGARLTVPVKLVREKLQMTQSELATLLHVPLGTLRNWEQNRFSIDPAVQALLLVLYREPEAALRALRSAA